MALYIGDQRVTPILGDVYSWWGDKNFESVCSTTATYSLSDSTNWTTLLNDGITTSAASLTYTTNITTAATVNPILYQWGSGLGQTSSTDKLDFINNDYFVLIDGFVKAEYTGDEATMGAGHEIKYLTTSLIPLYIIPKPTGVTTFNLTSNTFTGVALTMLHYTYRNNNNALAVYNTAGYGVYLTPVIPTFSPTSGSVANYINLRLPTISVRYQASRHALSAFNTMDANNTKIYIQEELFKAPKGNGLSSKVINRFVEMYENNKLPNLI